MKAIQVHELTSYIKRTIDMDYFLSNILVEGELSNVKTYQSGHTYFNLKDDRASLPCIFFAGKKKMECFLLKRGTGFWFAGVCPSMKKKPG
ncbi:exodeoxyribonuclease VII, large subunit domain protein [Peptoniphilus sp. oral taxon 375 str. F0436]|nr:exodeoxyribonuclease VII, large subunit domain protein [Peptoniphilus sp. oral taxon 375 str. F0436]